MRISRPFLPLAPLPILINRADQWPGIDIDDSTACSGAETAAQEGQQCTPQRALVESVLSLKSKLYIYVHHSSFFKSEHQHMHTNTQISTRIPNPISRADL